MQVESNNKYESHVFFSNVPIVNHQYKAERTAHDGRVCHKNVTPFVCVSVCVCCSMWGDAPRVNRQLLISWLPQWIPFIHTLCLENICHTRRKGAHIHTCMCTHSVAPYSVVNVHAKSKKISNLCQSDWILIKS